DLRRRPARRPRRRWLCAVPPRRSQRSRRLAHRCTQRRGRGGRTCRADARVGLLPARHRGSRAGGPPGGDVAVPPAHGGDRLMADATLALPPAPQPRRRELIIGTAFATAGVVMVLATLIGAYLGARSGATAWFSANAIPLAQPTMQMVT